MIKLIKEDTDRNEEKTKSAVKILAQISDKVEKAFSDYDIDWEFSKIDGNRDYIDREGYWYVPDLSLNITINNIIFSFKVEVFNMIAKKFEEPQVRFSFKGYEPQSREFTIQDAQDLLSVTKIVDKLKREIKQNLSKYSD